MDALVRPKLPRFVITELTRHGKRVYYYRRGKGRRIRLPDINDPTFRRVYDALLNGYDFAFSDEGEIAKKAAKRRAEHIARLGIERAIRSSRRRAEDKGLPFDLTLENLALMGEAQDWKCALSGLEFSKRTADSGRVNPYALTIDRIDPKSGYVIGNVRLVCLVMNIALMDWGEDVFAPFAEAYVKRRKLPK